MRLLGPDPTRSAGLSITRKVAKLITSWTCIHCYVLTRLHRFSHAIVFSTSLVSRWDITLRRVRAHKDAYQTPPQCPQICCTYHSIGANERIARSMCLLAPIFTALHVMQMRSSDENSVRLSARLSVTRVNCDKTVKDVSRFLYHTKNNLA